MAFKNLLAGKFKEVGIGSGSYTPSSVAETDTSSLNSTIGMILAVILVLIIILIVVHYTITPIFRLTPGGKGLIPVPGITRDDGAIYWEQQYPHGPLLEKDTIFDGVPAISKNYTMSIDFYFNDLNNGINTINPRPLFYRYNPAGQGLDYSVGIFLDPQVNDMHVMVRTVNNDIEVIQIRNIVAKIPIRIGVVVGEQYFEAYRNGQLVGTRRLRSAPKAAGGIFWAEPGSGDNIKSNGGSGGCPPIMAGPLGGAVNLHLWRRVLSPAELKFSTPALPAAELFTPGNKSSFLQRLVNKV